MASCPSIDRGKTAKHKRVVVSILDNSKSLKYWTNQCLTALFVRNMEYGR